MSQVLERLEWVQGLASSDFKSEPMGWVLLHEERAERVSSPLPMEFLITRYVILRETSYPQEKAFQASSFQVYIPDACARICTCVSIVHMCVCVGS